MFANTNAVGGVVGSFTNSSRDAFSQCLNQLQETFNVKNIDYATDIVKILRHEDLCESYMGTLLEDYAASSPVVSNSAEGAALAESLHANNNRKLEQLMENSRSAMLSEAQASGSLKPIVGLTMPLLKLYWIKNVYKDFIPTVVATQPTIKVGIERKYIQNPATKEKFYLPEAFEDPSINFLDMARQKLSTDAIPVPSLGFDLIDAAGGSIKNDDQVSKLFFVSKITYTGTEGDKTISVRIKADAGTGMFKYAIKEEGKVVDILMGDVDYETGILNLNSSAGKIKNVVVDGSLSSENHLRVLGTGWDKSVEQFEIPDGIHLSTGLTEERIKDEKIIYDVDTTAKIIEQMNETLATLKDIDIKTFLEKSRDRIKGTPLFIGTTFDCKPPSTLTNMSSTDWSKQELKETLDKLSLKLTQILKNENVMISVMGNPLDVRILDNVQWMYGKDSEIGGSKLGYSIGLYNNQRNFLIGSSERCEQGHLMIMVVPLTDEHITYKLFEYQFFISNEYRDPSNVRVKSVMASDRYLIDELTPVQGEIVIDNNLVSSSEIYKAGSDSVHA